MTTISRPVGDRCLVKDIVPVDELSVRAAQSKLVLVTYDKDKPRPTTGIVIAVGSGPLIQEEVREGDMVHFSRHAGTIINIAGAEYRSLEVHEIILVTRGKKEEIKALNDPRESKSESV